jgi:hypothetical protein
MELIMQQNQNWPFQVNDVVSPYFEAYSRYLRNVFTPESVLSTGVDKNNFVEKQFNLFIQNAHHTLDYMKEMMFIFEHNVESNLAKTKASMNTTRSDAREDASPFSTKSKSTPSSTTDKKSSSSKGKLSAKSSTKEKKGTQKTSSSWDSLESNTLKKDAAKEASPLKDPEHPFALGERSKGLLQEKTFKSTPSKSSFTDKKTDN